MGKMERKREVFVERVRSVVLLFPILFFGKKRGNPKIKEISFLDRSDAANVGVTEESNKKTSEE